MQCTLVGANTLTRYTKSIMQVIVPDVPVPAKAKIAFADGRVDKVLIFVSTHVCCSLAYIIGYGAPVLL